MVLELLMNELPLTDTFEGEDRLENYRQMVKLVSNGYKQQFENLVHKEEKAFKKDDVWHLLLAMKQIVMRNALKKLSIAYTRISEQDLCEKMGVSSQDNFEL